MASENKRMTHKQRFRAAEWIKKNRDTLMAEKPSRPALAKRLMEALHFPVPDSAVSVLQDMAGCNWTAIKKPGPKDTHKDFLTLVNAVNHIYRQLNEGLTGDFEELRRRVNGL
ncbi:MAG: hypothetical protein V3T30_04430 [Thermodesulfobacteriota bacterium]